MERISLTIPERFQKCFDYAMEWVTDEKDFKDGIKQRMKVDGRMTKYKIKSAKIRYMINYYVKCKILERRRNQEEKIKETPSEKGDT